jgi:hypothetical protein
VPGLTPLPESLPRLPPLPYETQAGGSRGSMRACVVIGVLLIKPSVPTEPQSLSTAPYPSYCDQLSPERRRLDVGCRRDDPPPSDENRVVNLQRLVAGQTLFISGAIFLAAAWRPR